jgi:hypothetical protein
MRQRAIDLQHLRQLRASRTAWVIHVAGDFLRTGGSQFIQPINQLSVTSTKPERDLTVVCSSFVIRKDGQPCRGRGDHGVAFAPECARGSRLTLA